MSTIREQILENIRTTLLGITDGNGYENTMQSVQRWDMRGNSIIQVPSVVICAGEEQKTPAPNPFCTCHLTVYLDVWFRQDAADALSTDTRVSGLTGDISKAIMQDYTRGGLAKDTIDHGSQPFFTQEGQPSAGIIYQIEVIYQHKQGDPAVAG